MMLKCLIAAASIVFVPTIMGERSVLEESYTIVANDAEQACGKFWPGDECTTCTLKDTNWYVVDVCPEGWYTSTTRDKFHVECGVSERSTKCCGIYPCEGVAVNSEQQTCGLVDDSCLHLLDDAEELPPSWALMAFSEYEIFCKIRAWTDNTIGCKSRCENEISDCADCLKAGCLWHESDQCYASRPANLKGKLKGIDGGHTAQEICFGVNTDEMQDGDGNNLVPAAVSVLPFAQATDGSSSLSLWEEHEKTFIILISVLGSLCLLFCCCIICRGVRRRERDERDRFRMMDIFKYLTNFDVDDFDIRHSPTGGFHATYLNELSHGQNKADEAMTTSSNSHSENSSDDMRSKLSHSSVANDYMFMSKVNLEKEGGGNTRISAKV
jgi:hypothetical protein